MSDKQEWGTIRHPYTWEPMRRFRVGDVFAHNGRLYLVSCDHASGATPDNPAGHYYDEIEQVLAPPTPASSVEVTANVLAKVHDSIAQAEQAIAEARAARKRAEVRLAQSNVRRLQAEQNRVRLELAHAASEYARLTAEYGELFTDN